jgi:MSHA pilin protein MshC
LIDVAVVMAAIGILAAVSAPRFFDDRTFLERGYFEELSAALKYAQKIAVASGCPVLVRIDASGYEARRDIDAGERCDVGNELSGGGVRLTDGRLLSGASPLGVAASPAVTMVFDAFGRPNLAADQSISVGSFELTVRADNGFVQLP